MNPDRNYFVYMMQSNSRRALYTGVTSKLEVRVKKHKAGYYEGFTSDYNCTRLVYFEKFSDMRDAIGREKQIKGWSRAKKEALVTKMNPEWHDLSLDWGKPQLPMKYTPPSSS